MALTSDEVVALAAELARRHADQVGPTPEQQACNHQALVRLFRANLH